jgi:putative sterol carrier protein
MTVEKLAETLESNLAGFAGLDARVAFDLGEDGAITIDATSTPPTLSKESGSKELGEADCTIRISAENLAKLIDGTLNPMMAYTLGKLKIDGNMGVAMKVAALLEE